MFRGWNEAVSQCNPHRGKRPGEDLARKSTGALRGPWGARGAEEPEAGKKGEGRKVKPPWWGQDAVQ